MTITVHHLQVSQSERIVWLCEELALDYKLVLHKRAPLFSPPEIKELNPLGAAPVLEDDSFGKKIVLAESGAIAEWIIRKHGGNRLMLPPEHPDYADFLYWWHASNGTIQPAVSRLLMLSRTKGPEAEAAIAGSVARLKLLLKLVDDRLSKNTWLAGEEFTAADIMSVWAFTTMRVFYQYSLEEYKGILGWLQRCGARPAYQKAMAKGDPGMGPYLDGPPPPLHPAL